MPFTPDQFLGVFAEYNLAFLPVVVAWWLAGFGAMVFAARNPVRWSRRLTLFLGALWLWNAVAYHARFFTRINGAAWLFAAMFAAQGLLFIWLARKQPFKYFSGGGWRRVAGVVLVLYAFAYPFLTLMSHSYPATPTFGVPCPTDLFTIGILLTVSRGIPAGLAVVPVIWSLIGGSAAVLLAVPTDYVLLAAGVLLTAVAVADRISVNRSS